MLTSFLNLPTLLYIPVIILILAIVHFRGKFYWIDNLFVKIDQLITTKKKKIVFYVSIMFFSFLLGYIISVVVFAGSDVNAAMTEAIKSYFLFNINPYLYPVVPHILPVPAEGVINGTYNYGPIDLVLYGIGYLFFSPFVGNSLWLYFTNVVFIIITYLIIRELVPISDTIKIIPFSFLTGFFLEDNSVLMFLVLSIAWLIQVKMKSEYKSILVVIILTLGVFTKLYIVFVLFGYFIFILKNNIKFWIINSIAVIITSLIILFPFGILNVIKSIFIFNLDSQIREKYAIIAGGLPYYLNLFGLDKFFIPLAIVLLFIFIFISEKYANNQTNLKFALFTILDLLLMPNSMYAFLIIPIFFLLVQYYQNNYNRTKKTEKTTKEESNNETPISNVNI